MSTRSDLEHRVRELAAALQVETPQTSGLKNEEIAEMVAEFETALVEAEAKAEREEKIAAEAQAKELANVNTNRDEFRGGGLKFEYEVPPGKQLKCRFGLLDGGAQVKPEYVGGQKQLDALVEARSVLKRA